MGLKLEDRNVKNLFNFYINKKGEMNFVTLVKQIQPGPELFKSILY